MTSDEGERATEETRGEIFLENRIFPLLSLHGGEGGKVSHIDYRGSCFLTRMGQQEVFVTAKHLLHDTPDMYDLYIAYSTPGGVQSYLRLRAAYVNHLDQDISFFIPTAEMREEYKGILFPMNWLRHELGIGQGVLVYGFPNSGQQNANLTPPVVQIQRARYEGKVVGIESKCPFPRMQRIYQIDIPSPMGLSGAPVMVVDKKLLAVAGYIIGEQTTSGAVFATASDNSPFVEIERLLIDVSRRLNQ